MKLYCYVLYKIRRLQRALRIWHGWFRTFSDIDFDTAHGLVVLCFPWFIALMLVVGAWEKKLGIALRSGLGETIVVGSLLLLYALLVGVSYLMLHSARYRAYASEFADYPARLRQLGSIFVFLLLVANALLPFWLLRWLA